MFDLIIKGGLVMIPIILGSIIGLAIILEKIWALYKLRLDIDKFSDDVFLHIKHGKFDMATDICKINIIHPLAKLYKEAIRQRHLSRAQLELMLEKMGNKEVKEMERYLGGLITVISLEPMLGFLGTIVGLIQAFMGWEKAGANVSVSILASGIYQAMITTAAGLIISIPYFAAYNFIASRIKYITHDLNDYSMQIIDILAAQKDK